MNEKDLGSRVESSAVAADRLDLPRSPQPDGSRRLLVIPEGDWRWFGSPGHLIVARDCRFHLCTQIGEFLVSTVGEYFPDEGVREILAQSRGVALNGRGDARRADYMQKIGYEEIGYGRTYETMVFRTTGDVCHAPGCGCGLPSIDTRELRADGYTTAGAATLGHYELCREVARGDVQS